MLHVVRFDCFHEQDVPWTVDKCFSRFRIKVACRFKFTVLSFFYFTQTTQENEAFDKEFGNFLRDLGSQVYKYKKTDVSQNEVHSSNSTVSTLPIKNYRRNPKYNTQKAILEDVLMMKLVSYYEDKYKLTHLEQTTMETVTRADADLKTNAPTKSNLYKYNVIDKDEVLNYNPIPTKHMSFGSNRRMENDMMYDDHFSDVVVF